MTQHLADPAVLATGGRVLTPVSPDATALAVTDGIVSWVGQDAPGPALYPDARSVDLAGAWVAPAFVALGGRADAGQTVGAAVAGGAGSGSQAAGGAGSGSQAASGHDAGRGIVYSELAGDPDLTIDAGSGDVDAFAARLEELAARDSGLAVARRIPTVLGRPDFDADTTQALARYGTVLLLDPLGPAESGVAGLDLVALAGTGLVIATRLAGPTGELDPWNAVRRLVDPGDGGRGLSPRAAFTAATRGNARAAGSRDGLGGTLAPGAPATFALWETGELVTKAADDAVQRWSTDPRSGVPPMPDLAGPDPVCAALWVDGAPVEATA